MSRDRDISGYLCTGADSGAVVSVGATIQRKRGFRVALTQRDALAERARGAFGAGWPLRVFEVSLTRADVLEEHAQGFRARAVRLVRELPAGEVLGPRAAEVAALLDEVNRIRWLSPDGFHDARVAELVAEHYAALADYDPVAAVPVRIVRTWHEARDLYNTVVPWEVAICSSAAVRTTCMAVAGTTVEGAGRLVVPAAIRPAFGGVFDAAWCAAGASSVSGAAELPRLAPLFPGDSDEKMHKGMLAIESLSVALAAAYEPARLAAWDVVLSIFTDTPRVLEPWPVLIAQAVRTGRQAAADFRRRERLECCSAHAVVRDTMVTNLLDETTQVAAQIAIMAGRQAGWQVACLLLQDGRGRDPWRPLLDLWRLGACPLGSSGDAFVVLLPEPQE